MCILRGIDSRLVLVKNGAFYIKIGIRILEFKIDMSKIYTTSTENRRWLTSK